MSRCAACGRRLRVPSPSGLGPVCARRLGVTTARPSRASPATVPGLVPPMDGQAELPLTGEPDPASPQGRL